MRPNHDTTVPSRRKRWTARMNLPQRVSEFVRVSPLGPFCPLRPFRHSLAAFANAQSSLWPRLRRAAPPALAALLSILLSFTNGCETKSRARLEARQAYVEGQEQALEQSRPKPPVVTVAGPVHNRVIPWTDQLTLGQAYLAAEYTGYIRPRLLRVTRDGQTVEFKFSALVNGDDLPLQPGDTIQVVP